MSAENDVEEVPETGTTVRKGRRPGIQIYEKNPFMLDLLEHAKVGTRRIANRDGTKFMIVSDHGEIVAPAAFHEVVEVDKTQFAKVYAQGSAAVMGLGAPGKKVWEFIFKLILGNPGVDRLWVHYKDAADGGTKPISAATFKRGMRELLEARFLAESDRPGMYWLNPTYAFNGDRLALIREYRLKSETDQKARNKQVALERAGQQRLTLDE